MPSKDEHLAKAVNNKKFADSLDASDSTSVGWALTALFYSALHYVDAFNAKFNHHCNNHQELKDGLTRNPQLEDIRDEYQDLSTFSWNARYQAVKYGRAELAEAQGCHAAVKRHIENLL
jgi:hypothetical protein